jgi:hypothetical protein
MHRARYEILPDAGEYYGEITGFDGVWASAATLDRCRSELAEVLVDWILLRATMRLPVP